MAKIYPERYGENGMCHFCYNSPVGTYKSCTISNPAACKYEKFQYFCGEHRSEHFITKEEMEV